MRTGRVHRPGVRSRKGRAGPAHEGAQQRVEQGKRAGQRSRARVHRYGYVRRLSFPPFLIFPAVL